MDAAEVSVGVGEAALGPFALVGVDAPDVSVDVGAEVAPVSGELGPFALVDLAVGDPMDPPEISVGVAGGVAPVSVDISIEAPACLVVSCTDWTRTPGYWRFPTLGTVGVQFFTWFRGTYLQTPITVTLLADPS